MRAKRVWVCLYLALGCALAPPHGVLAQRAEEASAVPKAEPGQLGAELWGLSEQSVKALGVTQVHAILVVRLLPDGPAERAGLRPGDVIVELDGAPVGTSQELVAAIQRLGTGRA